MLMASYFVLNLQYPKATSNSLEFIQRYMLKIHPEVSSRGTTRKIAGMPRKVSSLLSILADIEP